MKKNRERTSTIFGATGFLMFLMAAGLVMEEFGTACICMLLAGLFLSIGARIGGYMDE